VPVRKFDDPWPLLKQERRACGVLEVLYKVQERWNLTLQRRFQPRDADAGFLQRDAYRALPPEGLGRTVVARLLGKDCPCLD
jgi:hypothetical protein